MGSGVIFRGHPRHNYSAMTVRVFVTGGTFDKEYDELTGKLYFQTTHVEDVSSLKF